METCPICQRPVRSLKQWHNCVQVSVDDLFTGKKAALLPAFDKLLLAVADWPDTYISATQNCVIFTRRVAFLVVRPMQKALDIKFYSPEKLEEDWIYKSEVWAGKYACYTRIDSPAQVDRALLAGVRESYGICG